MEMDQVKYTVLKYRDESNENRIYCSYRPEEMHTFPGM